jgi:hypothetical protein
MNMADETNATEEVTAAFDYNHYLGELLRQETSEEAAKIRHFMMKRIATEGSTAVSRIPAPKNITELGGYINLLTSMREDEMLRKTVASALGIPHLSMPDDI